MFCRTSSLPQEFVHAFLLSFCSTKGEQKVLKIESFKSQSILKTLNTVDLRLIVGLSLNADCDGRINSTIQKIKDLGYMTPKLVMPTLKRLVNLGWVRKEGTDFFTNYTTNTSPNRKGHYYINLFKFFQTETFKTMYKRDILFIFYILTSKLPGTFHRVEIERLYRNKINKKSKRGLLIDYFTNFEDLVTHLTSLIEKGIFEVKLTRTKVLLTENTPNIKEHFYNYCGKNYNSRKKRIRHQEDHNVIEIRISEKILKEKTTVFDEERLSTLLDFVDIAAKYQCGVDLSDVKKLEPIHMFKHKLYGTFGKLGVQVYREAVDSFFKHQGYQFGKLMENGVDTFVKYLKHYYVMPTLTSRLKELFDEMYNKTRLGRSMFIDLSNEEMERIVSLEEEYKETTAPYVRYIQEEAYHDEIIKIDHYMTNKFNQLYIDFVHTNKDWMNFKQKVNLIFRTEEVLGNTKKDVYRLALQNKLNNQERIDFQLNQKREEKRQERREVLFYNWLEE